jgi:hypothetical protein
MKVGCTVDEECQTVNMFEPPTGRTRPEQPLVIVLNW